MFNSKHYTDIYDLCERLSSRSGRGTKYGIKYIVLCLFRNFTSILSNDRKGQLRGNEHFIMEQTRLYKYTRHKYEQVYDK